MVIEAETVPELEVAAMSVEMEYKEREQVYLPSARPLHHPEITHGKAGGRKLRA